MEFPKRFKQYHGINYTMFFKIKRRDGPARIGELLVNKSKIITPNILFVNSKRFKAPDFADILITNNDSKKVKATLKISDYFVYLKDLSKEFNLSEIKIQKKEKNNYYVLPGNKDVIDKISKDNSASFFIIANAFQLFQQPKKFVDFIVTLREKIGYQKIIYLPSIGNPNNFALLSYMCVDFFDSLQAIVAARNNMLLFQKGQNYIEEINELPCSCPSCIKFKDELDDMDFVTILNHNYYVMSNEIKHVRNAIKQNCLRNLVETRVKTSPHLTAVLRNFDMNHYRFLEKRTSVTSKTMVLATAKESLSRPEIKRFQHRLIDRYSKPESAKVLLLLPCSVKKPYSFSKSHRLYRDQLLSSGNPFVFHEMIITSPLGLVPRELELVYPASCYDIPVTGVWDEDEKKMIQVLLKKYLDINKYDKIIAHLPKEIMGFIEGFLEKAVVTCIDHPTSKKSLANLLKILKETSESYDKVKSQIRIKEDINCFSSYQFGRKTSKNLLKNCTIKGKYPYQKIMYNNTQLGMITRERGLISLTMNGAEKLVSSKKYWVEIFDDFKLKGSLFAPGVKESDENIRVGDEVIVLQKGKLQGIGVAMMNGEEMKELSHGEAIKIRHKA